MNRDFIPEGEDAGGLGSGFRDFVPAKEPVAPVIEVKEPSFKELKKQYTELTGQNVQVGTSKADLIVMIDAASQPKVEEVPAEIVPEVAAEEVVETPAVETPVEGEVK